MSRTAIPLNFRITSTDKSIVIDAIEHSGPAGEISAGFIVLNNIDDMLALRTTIDKYIFNHTSSANHEKE